MVQIKHGEGHPSIWEENETGEVKVADISVVKEGVVGVLELIDTGLWVREGVVDVQVGQLVVKCCKTVGSS